MRLKLLIFEREIKTFSLPHLSQANQVENLATAFRL